MTRTITIECRHCHGTGLYQGRYEVNGAAIVCYHCNGTGKEEFTYTEFEGRKKAPAVTRVFSRSCGYMHSGKDETLEDGTVLHFSKYGCSYEEWEKGAKPAPMEELYCPRVYYNNGSEDFPCSRCKSGCGGLWVSIPDCKFYGDKAKCWEEWHKNND